MVRKYFIKIINLNKPVNIYQQIGIFRYNDEFDWILTSLSATTGTQ